MQLDQDLGHHPLPVRWIEENEIEAISAGIEALQGAQRRLHQNLRPILEAAVPQVGAENLRDIARRLDGDQPRGAAGERFQPQGSRAGEKIQHTSAGNCISVVQYAKGRRTPSGTARPDLEATGNVQSPPFGLAGNQPHESGLRVRTRSVLQIGPEGARKSRASQPTDDRELPRSPRCAPGPTPASRPRRSPSAMIWAVVPAKLGKNAKERLAPVLQPAQRERLARAMLRDVLRSLGDCPQIAGTIVVSHDEAVLSMASEIGATGIREESAGGLNPSVVQGIHEALSHGATGALLAMGDLPLLSASDVAETVAALPERGVVLVPSADGTGTNLVAVRPANLLTPAFGPASLAKHLERVRAAELEAVVHPCAGAALDVDTPADLERLRHTALPTHSATRRVLAASGVAAA